MPFDFDTEIDREGTGSVKWEFHVQAGRAAFWDATHARQGRDRVLPMWVADMDFRCPEPVIQAMRDRVEHGIFGYANKPPSYDEALVGWFQRRQGWSVDPEWVIPTPGVVPTLNVILGGFTEPGDLVIIQQPVYHPFLRLPGNHGLEIVSNSLVYENGAYRLDLDDLEAKAAHPRAKVLVLCSPHNPIARSWSREDLTAIAEICARNGVLVVADEIHGDLMFPGVPFVPFATLGDVAADNTIVCTAPSKTFNLAGLHNANTIIPNPEIRERFMAAKARATLPGMGPFGIVATEAAYREGDAWLDAAMAYIAGNAEHMDAFFAAELPALRLVRPDSTYLMWVDCTALGLGVEALQKLMFDDARLYFNQGEIFGPEGEGFVRINVACPRSILDDCLNRLRDAVATLS